jgi:hypothetical protein
MTRGQMIEYEIVTRAVGAGEGEGAMVVMSDLVQEMRERFAGAEYADVLDALKRLLLQQVISLRKWDASNMAYRDYRGESEDAFFFSRGDFRVKRTPFSRTYLEQFEPPADVPPKRPIGFTS